MTADPGQLDETFNGTGERVISYSTDQESATDLVLSADGKPINVGTTIDDLTVTRLRPVAGGHLGGAVTGQGDQNVVRVLAQ